MAAPPITERHKHHFHRQSPIKESVRAATTGNITISTALNNGDSLDGLTLATGDRVLVKNQSTGSQNGIYVVGVTPVRDYDVSTDDPAFSYLVFVREGTANAGTLWTNTNVSTPTIGTTALTFAQFSTGGSSTSPFFLPEDYGAVGDDSTDDSTAFANMFTDMTAAGGGVALLRQKYVLPAGTGNLTDPHFHLWGLGNEYGPAQIRTTNSNATAISFSSSWADASRTYQGSVRDLLIKGAGSAASGRGIYAKSNIDIEHVGIQGFFDGVYYDDKSYYSRARDVFITGCPDAAFYLNQTNNITIDACRMTGDPLGVSSLDAIGYGVKIVSALPFGETIRIQNSSIEYFTLDAIYADGAAALVIEKDYFETQQSSTGHAYINLGPGGSNVVAPAVIRGCHFDGPNIAGFIGIKTDRASYVTIENNEDTVSFGALGTIISSTANGSRFLQINNKWGAGTVTLPASSYTLDPASPPMTSGDAAGGDLSGTYPNPSVVDDSHSHTAATLPATSAGVGAILISDTPSTPLIFADLVQNEAQDDLVYADL